MRRISKLLVVTVLLALQSTVQAEEIPREIHNVTPDELFGTFIKSEATGTVRFGKKYLMTELVYGGSRRDGDFFQFRFYPVFGPNRALLDNLQVLCYIRRDDEEMLESLVTLEPMDQVRLLLVFADFRPRDIGPNSIGYSLFATPCVARKIGRYER